VYQQTPPFLISPFDLLSVWQQPQLLDFENFGHTTKNTIFRLVKLLADLSTRPNQKKHKWENVKFKRHKMLNTKDALYCSWHGDVHCRKRAKGGRKNETKAEILGRFLFQGTVS